MDSIQENFYSTGADISRLEQEIKINKEKASGFNLDLKHKKDILQSKEIALEELNKVKKQIQDSIYNISPELKRLRDDQLKENPQNSKLIALQGEWNSFSASDIFFRRSSILLSVSESGKNCTQQNAIP